MGSIWGFLGEMSAFQLYDLFEMNEFPTLPLCYFKGWLVCDG